MGAGACGDASDADSERAEKQGSHRDGRKADEREGRGDRGDPRRGGVRFCDSAPCDHGVSDDARLQSGHLPGGSGDPEPGASQALHGQAGVRGELYAVYRAGTQRVHGEAGRAQGR